MSLLGFSDRPPHILIGIFCVLAFDALIGILLFHAYMPILLLLGLIQYAWILPFTHFLKKRQMDSLRWGINFGAGAVVVLNVVLLLVVALVVISVVRNGNRIM